MKHITLLLSILLFSTSVMAQDIDPFDVDMTRPINAPIDNTTDKSGDKTSNKTDASDNKSTPVKKNKDGSMIILDNEMLFQLITSLVQQIIKLAHKRTQLQVM